MKKEALTKSKTAIVEKWKILTFGKYINTNIDEIPTLDKNYAFWLIKNSTENRIKGRFYNDLDRYILSDAFLIIVKKANKRNDWYISIYEKDIKDAGLAEKLITKSVPFTTYPDKIEFFIMKAGKKIIIGETFDKHSIERFATEKYPACVLSSVKPDRMVIRVCLQSSIVK